jgi:hypothetical protein
MRHKYHGVINFPFCQMLSALILLAAVSIEP